MEITNENTSTANLLGSTEATEAPVSDDRTTLSRAKLTRQDFYKIMIAEMTNQDPFEPLDNQQFLDQLSSLQALETTEKNLDAAEKSLEVTERLAHSVDRLAVQGQLSSLSSLIGKNVVASPESAEGTEPIRGEVTSVRMNGDLAELVLQGDGAARTVSVDQVTQVT